MPKANTKTNRKGMKQKFVPYVKEFNPCTKKEKQDAIGQRHKYESAFDPYSKGAGRFVFFRGISRPTSEYDWLACENEPGQSYDRYMKRCPWFSKNPQTCTPTEFNSDGNTILEKYPKGKIHLVPIGEFSKSCAVDIAILAEYASMFLGIPVEVCDQVDVIRSNNKIMWKETIDNDLEIEHEIKHRSTEKSEHIQFETECLLDRLYKSLPKNSICMIGLTMYDLYAASSDLFVAGFASGIRNVAVFSFYRYDPCLEFSEEDWFDVEIKSNVKAKDRFLILLQRSCKLLVHEICHLLGIGHCVYFDCCMNGSGHLEEDFRQSPHLCPVDLHKLYSLVGFDLLQRYEQLLSFYQKYNMEDETEWVTKRIHFIRSKKE